MFMKAERIERIVKELGDHIYSDAQEVNNFSIKKIDTKDLKEVEASQSPWEDFKYGQKAEEREHYWIRTEVSIPESFAGKVVVFELAEGLPECVSYINKEIVQGVDRNHRHLTLTENAVPGEKYTIDFHGFNGTDQANDQGGFAGSKGGKIKLKGRLVVLNKEIERLYYDLDVPLNIAKLHDKEDKKRIDILNYLSNAVNILDLRKAYSPEFFASINEAVKYLEEEFYGNYCGDSDVVAHCIGHTHIDVAWLWILDQTREKVGRSFSTVLNYMKDYPEYLFMSSQPQLYKYLKEGYPEVYEQLKERVKEGRWEAEGGMWLEADCNVSSGESLIRQILFGTRFFKEEFGVDNKILWLPDVFGYSAALPQILKKFGIDYFMTTKISWNEYNTMPCDTFTWEGLDGSKVLSHLITTSDYKSDGHFTTYNGNINPSQIMGSWKRYQQKDINDEVLVCFGHGDGGGGPTKGMLENARRMNKGIPGCPKVEMNTALDYFKKLDEKVSDNDKLPKWVGELYLEYHRGTYTSMARNKKYNRKCEFLYQDTEFFNVLNQNIAGVDNYPQQEINDAWETILLNQFHDIIPGTSIKPVYEESKEQYEEIIERGEGLLDSALDNIVANIKLEDTSVVVFNQLGFERNDVVESEIPEGYQGVKILDKNGEEIPSQIIEDKEGVRKLIFFAKNVPAKGYKTFTIKEDINSNNGTQMTVSKDQLSNQFFDIKLDENANIESIYDKKNDREILKAGEKANVLQAFEDKPHNWDAWDINIYYQEKEWEVNDVEGIEVVDNGPVRATLKIKRSFVDSTIEQYIHIYHQLARIDFSNVIDWKEKQVLLKAAFPVDIHTDKATYEIQYGNVERPTHWNTSWDKAKFEVVGHKWADLSEDNYGVSLLNDCKYGYDIKDGVMRLSLLKSATSPNEDADREVHEFTYSLYPHQGDWKEGNTVEMAYELNCPMYSKLAEANNGDLSDEYSFVHLEQENVKVEVIKKAEDSEDIIVRLYECYNRRSKVEANFAEKLESAWECDLNEDNIEELKTENNSFSFEIKPYEIKTFKLKFA